MRTRAPARLTTLLLFAASAALLLFRCTGAEPLDRVETPVARSVPAPAFSPRATVAREEALRIGPFAAPEGVPEYEILQRTPDERDGAEALRLLVDTRSRSEEDLTLIARDLKARFAGYDAVSAEFTDTTDVLDYNGSALIFNTYDGATYLGYIYGPPNLNGYYVTAAP